MGIIPETPARGRIRRRSRQEWEHLDPAASELLQHELDHLDGVLAIDLAEAEGIISREAFRTWTDHFTAMVDYTIQ